MKRRIVLFAALALILAPRMFAGPWHKSVAAAQKAASEKKQLILVDMFAEWCGWCHRFEREVFPSMVFQTATDDMVLLRLDTEDGGEGTKMSQKFGVSSLPTFLILTPELTLAGELRGYAPPAEFVRKLKDTRATYETFLNRVKTEASYATDYPRRLTLAKDFLQRKDYANSQSRLRKLTGEKGVPPSIRDEAYYQLAVSYAMQEKFDDAIKTAKKLTSLSKKGTAVENAYMLTGQVYFQQGNLKSAAAELRNLKKAFPQSALIRNVDMMLPEIERRIAAGK